MGKKKAGLPFIQLHYWVYNSRAFRHLSPAAKVAYLALKSKYNGKNNGALAFGARAAAEDMAMSRSSANRALLELEEHGFIARQVESSFNSKRLSIEWNLTELRNDITGALATKDFLRWQPNGANDETSRAGQRHVDSSSNSLQVPLLTTNSEKMPVPPVVSTVSSMGSERPSAKRNLHFSPTEGTGTAKGAPLQSRRRDTYTSEPYRPPQRGLDGSVLLMNVRASIRRLTDDPEILQWETPVAARIVDEMVKSQFEDPLVLAVQKVFPGSKLKLNAMDVDRIVEKHLNEIRLHRSPTVRRTME